MKNPGFVLLVCFLLGGCASHSPYRPAGHNGYGYTETQISEQRFRIIFKSRGNNRNSAMDYALLRAAELTTQKGYDWFEVIDRNAEVLRSERDAGSQFGASTTRHNAPSRNGLLTVGGHRDHYLNESSMQLNLGNEQSKIEAQLEIWMDKGVRPDSRNAYSALEVANTLRSQLVNPQNE